MPGSRARSTSRTDRATPRVAPILVRPRKQSMRETPLNLTDGFHDAAREIIDLVPEFAHIKVEQVHFAIFHSRAAQQTLTFARCYPLSTEIKRRGRRVYALSHVYTPQGKRAKYLLAFAWTRFWDMSPRERLETLVHELYHIGPRFDGEPRLFEQGGWHGRGRVWFDKIIHKICEEHLPHGLELEHPVLALEVEPGMRFLAEKLLRPNWEEVLRGP
jgi:Putative phage metallopeptidase